MLLWILGCPIKNSPDKASTPKSHSKSVRLVYCSIGSIKIIKQPWADTGFWKGDSGNMLILKTLLMPGLPVALYSLYFPYVFLARPILIYFPQFAIHALYLRQFPHINRLNPKETIHGFASIVIARRFFVSHF